MTERTMPKEGTQARKVLDVLVNAKGEWVSGRYFLHTLYLSQYHARIWDLQNKFGWKVEPSTYEDSHGFKFYRVPVEQDAQLTFV